MKAKKLFLFGSLLMMSNLIFSVSANELETTSKINADPKVVDVKQNVTDISTSKIIDDGSNDSGVYHIGDGDLGEVISNVTEVKDDTKESKLGTNLDSKSEIMSNDSFDQRSTVVNSYTIKEPIFINNHSDMNDKPNVMNVKSTSDGSKIELTSNNSVGFDDTNNDKVGELIDLKTVDKPIGKITRLKTELPLTGVMNSKQSIVVSLVLMLSGLISLLYVFSRKYLG